MFRFGKTKYDDVSILAPLYQCCLMRASTVRKLLAFQRGPEHLSDRLRSSLANDLLPGVLTEAHLEAVDRRVAIILEHMLACTQDAAGSERRLFIEDGI